MPESIQEQLLKEYSPKKLSIEEPLQVEEPAVESSRRAIESRLMAEYSAPKVDRPEKERSDLEHFQSVTDKPKTSPVYERKEQPLGKAKPPETVPIETITEAVKGVPGTLKDIGTGLKNVAKETVQLAREGITAPPSEVAKGGLELVKGAGRGLANVVRGDAAAPEPVGIGKTVDVPTGQISEVVDRLDEPEPSRQEINRRERAFLGQTTDKLNVEKNLGTAVVQGVLGSVPARAFKRLLEDVNIATDVKEKERYLAETAPEGFLQNTVAMVAALPSDLATINLGGVITKGIVNGTVGGFATLEALAEYGAGGTPSDVANTALKGALLGVGFNSLNAIGEGLKVADTARLVKTKAVLADTLVAAGEVGLLSASDLKLLAEGDETAFGQILLSNGLLIAAFKSQQVWNDTIGQIRRTRSNQEAIGAVRLYYDILRDSNDPVRQDIANRIEGTFLTEQGRSVEESRQLNRDSADVTSRGVEEFRNRPVPEPVQRPTQPRQADPVSGLHSRVLNAIASLRGFPDRPGNYRGNRWTIEDPFVPSNKLIITQHTHGRSLDPRLYNITYEHRHTPGGRITLTPEFGVVTSKDAKAIREALADKLEILSPEDSVPDPNSRWQIRYFRDAVEEAYNSIALRQSSSDDTSGIRDSLLGDIRGVERSNEDTQNYIPSEINFSVESPTRMLTKVYVARGVSGTDLTRTNVRRSEFVARFDTAGQLLNFREGLADHIEQLVRRSGVLSGEDVLFDESTGNLVSMVQTALGIRGSGEPIVDVPFLVVTEVPRNTVMTYNIPTDPARQVSVSFEQLNGGEYGAIVYTQDAPSYTSYSLRTRQQIFDFTQLVDSVVRGDGPRNFDTRRILQAEGGRPTGSLPVSESRSRVDTQRRTAEPEPSETDILRSEGGGRPGERTEEPDLGIAEPRGDIGEARSESPQQRQRYSYQPETSETSTEPSLPERQRSRVDRARLFGGEGTRNRIDTVGESRAARDIEKTGGITHDSKSKRIANSFVRQLRKAFGLSPTRNPEITKDILDRLTPEELAAVASDVSTAKPVGNIPFGRNRIQTHVEDAAGRRKLQQGEVEENQQVAIIDALRERGILDAIFNAEDLNRPYMKNPKRGEAKKAIEEGLKESASTKRREQGELVNKFIDTLKADLDEMDLTQGQRREVSNTLSELVEDPRSARLLEERLGRLDNPQDDVEGLRLIRDSLNDIAGDNPLRRAAVKKYGTLLLGEAPTPFSSLSRSKRAQLTGIARKLKQAYGRGSSIREYQDLLANLSRKQLAFINKVVKGSDETEWLRVASELLEKGRVKRETPKKKPPESEGEGGGGSKKPIEPKPIEPKPTSDAERLEQLERELHAEEVLRVKDVERRTRESAAQMKDEKGERTGLKKGEDLRKDREKRTDLAEALKEVNSRKRGSRRYDPRYRPKQASLFNWFFDGMPEWFKPKDPNDRQAQEVHELYADSESASLAFRKGGMSMRDRLSVGFVDMTGPARRKLIEGWGELGRKIVMMQSMISGSIPEGHVRYQDIQNKVWSGLTAAEENLFNRILASRRTIIVSERPDLLGVRNPRGLNAEPHRKYLEAIKRDYPNAYKRVNERVDRLFKVFRAELEYAFQNGLIDRASYEAMRDAGDYSPRRYLHHLDPDSPLTYEGSSRRISVRDSGLRRIDRGSLELMETDSRLLTMTYVTGIRNRVFRNEANKGLLELARTHPDNGIVRELLPGVSRGNVVVRQPLQKFRTEEEIFVFENGERKSLAVEQNFAKQWVVNDPFINSIWATAFSRLTGAALVRQAATVKNPGFAITNFPRDVAHVYLATHEYSTNPLIYLGQMARDLVTVAPDAWGRIDVSTKSVRDLFAGRPIERDIAHISPKGRLRDFFAEGGGMQWLSVGDRSGSILRRLFGASTRTELKMEKLDTLLGYLQETSELWTRLALRERAIRNGKSSQEATFIARDVLDFAKGGYLGKAASLVTPFFGANIQATRGIVRATKENFPRQMSKVAQMMAMSAGAYIAFRTHYPDMIKAIPQEERDRNFIIPLPFKTVDRRTGLDRYWYIPITLDSGQILVNSITNLMMARYFGDKHDGRRAFKSATELFAQYPTNSPVGAAILGATLNKNLYTKQDAYTGRKLSKGIFGENAAKQYWANQDPFFVQMGKTLKVDPNILEGTLDEFAITNNTFAVLFSATIRNQIRAAGLSAEQQEGLMKMMLERRELPFARRLIKSTTGASEFRTQKEDASLKVENIRHDNDVKLNKILDTVHPREKRLPREVEKKVDKLISEVEREDPIEARRLKANVREFARFHMSTPVEDREFWRAVMTLDDSRKKARLFFSEWYSSSKDKRRELERQADRIISGDAFWHDFTTLKRQTMKEERKNNGK